MGSGAKNLITQNGTASIDLDYNLEIKKLYTLDINDCKGFKEYIEE